MTLPITLSYGGALAIWFLVLSIRVIQARGGPGRPSLGDGGDMTLQRRIRGHGNFSEYVPLTLLLLGFLEVSGTTAWKLHAIGASLLTGRLMHGYTFAFAERSVIGRVGGIALTLIALLSAGLLSLVSGLQAL